MGGYGPMIAQGMANKAVLDVAHQRELEQLGRQQTLEFNQGILNNPDAPDEQKLQARQNIQGLYPTPAHAPQFLLDLLHIKHKQAQGNQPAQSQAQSQANAVTNTPTPGSGGTESAASAGPPTASNPAEILQGAAPQVPSSPSPAPASPSAAPSSPSSAPAAASPVAQVRRVGQAQTPEEALAQIHAYASPGQQANTLAQNMQKAMMQREIELAKARGEYGVEEALIRAQGNVSMQKLNGAAQALGAEDFASASPEVKMQAIKSLHMANVTQSWKAEPGGPNGTDIFAVDAHNPSAPKVLIGHKSDLTENHTFRTETNPDGSTYLVPITTWTKKGSSAPAFVTEDQPTAAPVSANTPSGPTAGTSTPPNGGAVTSVAPPTTASANQDALNGKLNKKKSQSKQVPVSANTPSVPGIPKGAIPFGGKPSPLLKTDQEQYTKAAEDATAKRQVYENAQGLLSDPNRKTDLELVFSWVRSNVQGAGRMTNTEITQAAQVGSFGERIKNAWSQASTGRLAPEIEKQFSDDIQRSYLTAQKSADALRQQVDDEMHGRPISTKTPTVPTSAPPPPAGSFNWNSAPVHQ